MPRFVKLPLSTENKQTRIRWIMKDREKNGRMWNLFISFFVTAVMFATFRFFTDFIFLTNDDMYLQAIVSGELAGTPQARMIYSNYILGLILSGLYTISVQIPWYGIYLTGTCFLCFWAVLYRCLTFCKSFRVYPAVIFLFFMLGFCAVFRHVAMLQYTVVAALAGATAVFLALTMDIKCSGKELVLNYAAVAFFASASLLIREKVFFMTVPFAACGWLGKYFSEKEKTKETHMRYLLLLVGILAVMLAFCWADRLAYRVGTDNEAWQEYKAYNRAREQIMDYQGFPDYDANEEFYLELGIGREAFLGAQRYYLLLPQDAFHGESMKRIASLACADKKASESIWGSLSRVFREFLRCNGNYSDRPVNIVVYCAWIVMAVFVILTHKKELLLQMALVFLARMGMWGLILYQGRYPDRITQSLYLVELLMLLSLFLLYCKELKTGWVKKYYKVFLWAAALFVCVPSFYTGVQKAWAVKGENAGKLYFGISYRQLKEYCAQYPDNLYLIDMNSAGFFTCSVFQTPEDKEDLCRNLLPLGSWPVKSPLVAENLKEYGVVDPKEDLVDRDQIFFVFKDSDATPNAYLTEFYNAEYGENGSGGKVVLERVDTVDTDVDITYGIWQLKTME